MVDRDPIRTSVRQLDSNQARILVVFGDQATGKSHITNLITWRAAADPLTRMVSVDLAQLWQIASAEQRRLTPRDIATRFCDQLGIGYEIIPGNDEQDSRWAIIFCDRLQPRLATGQLHWFVIDEFNKIPASQQVVDLIKELATRVSTVMTNVRLVLLGYADVLPTNVEPGVLREQVLHLGEDDIKRTSPNCTRSPAAATMHSESPPLLRASCRSSIPPMGPRYALWA